MSKAKSGDTVRVHYTGMLDDGTVFDSSTGREPLEFQIGSHQVIGGFEEAVEGLEEGESVVAKLAPEEAYGPRRDELTMTVPKGQLPEGIEPEVGQRLALRRPDGGTMPVVVSEVTDEAITLDANHPLAGHELTFSIQLVQVV